MHCVVLMRCVVLINALCRRNARLWRRWTLTGQQPSRPLRFLSLCSERTSVLALQREQVCVSTSYKHDTQCWNLPSCYWFVFGSFVHIVRLMVNAPCHLCPSLLPLHLHHVFSSPSHSSASPHLIPPPFSPFLPRTPPHPHLTPSLHPLSPISSPPLTLSNPLRQDGRLHAADPRASPLQADEGAGDTRPHPHADARARSPDLPGGSTTRAVHERHRHARRRSVSAGSPLGGATHGAAASRCRNWRSSVAGLIREGGGAQGEVGGVEVSGKVGPGREWGARGRRKVGREEVVCGEIRGLCTAGWVTVSTAEL